MKTGRPVSVRWNKDHDEPLRVLRRKGWSCSRIARDLNTTPWLVEKRLAQLNIPNPHQRLGSWTPEQDNVIRRHARLSDGEIAEQLVLAGFIRRSEGAIYARIGELGLRRGRRVDRKRQWVFTMKGWPTVEPPGCADEAIRAQSANYERALMIGMLADLRGAA